MFCHKALQLFVWVFLCCFIVDLHGFTLDLTSLVQSVWFFFGITKRTAVKLQYYKSIILNGDNKKNKNYIAKSYVNAVVNRSLMFTICHYIHEHVCKFSSIKFNSIHLYTWVERDTVEKSVLPKNTNTMSPARVQTQRTQYIGKYIWLAITSPPPHSLHTPQILILN